LARRHASRESLRRRSRCYSFISSEASGTRPQMRSSAGH